MPSERCLSIHEMLTGQRLCQSSSHNDAVLAALNQQRSDGILCDITLIAEEQKFHAHKAVLAACSDYFRAAPITPQLYEEIQGMENGTPVDHQFHEHLSNFMNTNRGNLKTLSISFQWIGFDLILDSRNQMMRL